MRKTLVMIPAFGCDGGLYDEIRPSLAQIADVQTVIANASSFAGMVAQVLDAVPGRFIVLGTSMGGRVALETALAAPERVEGLVVVGAGAGGVADAKAGRSRSARLKSGDMEGVLQDMGDKIAYLPGPRGPATRQAFIVMGRKVGGEVMARQSDALALRVDRWADTGAITCPTLCLWGENDQFSPATEGRRLARSVQRGHYAELPACGHFPTLEYPQESAVLIADWLRRVF